MQRRNGVRLFSDLSNSDLKKAMVKARTTQDYSEAFDILKKTDLDPNNVEFYNEIGEHYFELMRQSVAEEKKSEYREKAIHAFTLIFDASNLYGEIIPTETALIHLGQCHLPLNIEFAIKVFNKAADLYHFSAEIGNELGVAHLMQAICMPYFLDGSEEINTKKEEQIKNAEKIFKSARDWCGRSDTALRSNIMINLFTSLLCLKHPSYLTLKEWKDFYPETTPTTLLPLLQKNIAEEYNEYHPNGLPLFFPRISDSDINKRQIRWGLRHLRELKTREAENQVDSQNVNPPTTPNFKARF